LRDHPRDILAQLPDDHDGRMLAAAFMLIVEIALREDKI
jgi:hypothetical protein